MSARSTRAATAGSLALALALALPAAAFADDDRGRDQGSSERAEDHGRSGSAPHGSAGKDRDAREDDKDRDREDGEDRKAREDDREAGKDRKAGAAKDGERSEGRDAGQDPRGNNGTVKIDGEAFDDGRGNEPHVGCTFQVDFYGFDAGDTATITFTGHAPTGGGLLHTESRTISTDAAGGGQDRDATFTYSVADQLSELRAVTPHPKQGWHVKLAVDVDSAPGGAKQKVFWIDCPAPAAAAPTTTTTTTTPTTGTTLGAGTTESPAGPVTSQGAGTATVLPAAVVSGTTVAAAGRQDALTLGAGTATLAAGETGSVVEAQGAAQPSVLPFTGTQALLSLLALGLSAVGVGALAHRMGRRTAEV